MGGGALRPWCSKTSRTVRTEVDPGVDLGSLEERAPRELSVAAQARDVASDRIALENDACIKISGQSKE